jgi:hypothetical protein
MKVWSLGVVAFFKQYIPKKVINMALNYINFVCRVGTNMHLKFTIEKKTKPKGHAHDVVMRLMDGSLFTGRTLYTDNFYTSVPLA